MSRVRCTTIVGLLLALAVASRAGAEPSLPAPVPDPAPPAPSETASALAPAIDSLVTLPSLLPVDPDANVRLTPHAIAIDPLGRPWILDRARGRVLILSGATGIGRSVSVTNAGAAGVFPFADIAASGSYVFLLDPSSPSLTLLDLDGFEREVVDLADEVALAGAPGFSANRLLVGLSGDLWLIDSRGDVLHFDRRGRFLSNPLERFAGGERPARIADAALTPDDGVILLDPMRPSLVTLRPSGEKGRVSILAGEVVEPAALAADRVGNAYVLEASGRVRVIDPEGIVLYDGGSAGGREDALGRATITPDGILLRADPAGRSIRTWRVVRNARGDAR